MLCCFVVRYCCLLLTVRCSRFVLVFCLLPFCIKISTAPTAAHGHSGTEIEWPRLRPSVSRLCHKSFETYTGSGEKRSQFLGRNQVRWRSSSSAWSLRSHRNTWGPVCHVVRSWSPECHLPAWALRRIVQLSIFRSRSAFIIIYLLSSVSP